MPFEFLKDKIVLVTGGTGSFGRYFVDAALQSPLKKLIVFSRDEYKQFEMQKQISDPRARFFLGDVRDLPRLQKAFTGVDIVVHAAALKQVPALEYNPLEAVKTNVFGTQNVLDAAIDNKVEKVLLISTDKAVNPVSLYGATKLCAEKLFVAANSYRGWEGRPNLSVVRYGNVIGSRGSLVEALLKEPERGEVMLTHEDMTRFWLKLEDAVSLVMSALSGMKGGEVFVPKVPSMKVQDLILALAPNCEIKTVGVRAGEKIHEALLTSDEIRRTRDFGPHYVVEPLDHEWWNGEHLKNYPSLPANFVYTSDCNNSWLKPEEIRSLVKMV
ncbi:MAG: UDP-N-acetylglucosamine 4,6-dehydratase (inverting) [bacterium]|nr:UDP-N-acetylglucosamine 4,6-dehydratase (inverting) [bacterium]